MATKKQTAISIRSVIHDLDPLGSAVGEPEITELSATGLLVERDGIARLTYTEEGEGGRVDCELLLCKGCVRLKRRGAVALDLELREGEEYSTVYSIPPYRFDMCVSAKRVAVEPTAGGIRMLLAYDMSVGGASRRVEMTLSATEAE